MEKSQDATVIVDTYKKMAMGSAGQNSYEGLRIHALTGLHDFIEAKALKYLEPGARLLDLAAGTGSMSLRMKNLGFSVSATDYVRENFALDSIPFIQADLNAPFSQSFLQPFKAIVATEIIEHLENPRNFARECFKILEPGGRMVVTTPNPESSTSIAMFIYSGCFAWFDDTSYEMDGHITPLTRWHLRKSFIEAGFIFLWDGGFGTPKKFIGWPKLELLRKFIDFITTRGAAYTREINVFVVEKPAGK